MDELACPSGCGGRVAAGKMACGSCWAEIPYELQKAVYATWRAVQKDIRTFPAYRAARDAALASIK